MLHYEISIFFTILRIEKIQQQLRFGLNLKKQEQMYNRKTQNAITATNASEFFEHSL